MKKLVLILSATFSSISAFANEDFASNEIANDEIVAQTFADGANNEIAALSSEEMQETKGAYTAMDYIAAGTYMTAGALEGWTAGTLMYESLPNVIQDRLGRGAYGTVRAINDIIGWSKEQASDKSSN